MGNLTLAAIKMSNSPGSARIHSPTFDNQLDRNGIRVIKISLKQREYTFFVALSLHAVAAVVA